MASNRPQFEHTSGGHDGPTKQSANAIIYPSPLWFYRLPDVVKKDNYYEVDCFSENNYHWETKDGLKEVKEITFEDAEGVSHNVLFLGLDNYFCYKWDSDNDTYVRVASSPAKVEDAVETDLENKASYWAKPVTLILTIPSNTSLAALCVRQACWDRENYCKDPSGEEWGKWAEKFSDIPLTTAAAASDSHLFGPIGGDYSAWRTKETGSFFYMNGIVYNMQQYTECNSFHITLPAQCIVEWVVKPKPPYWYWGLGWMPSAFPNTIADLRKLITNGEYEEGLLKLLIPNPQFSTSQLNTKESIAMTPNTVIFPDYIWDKGYPGWTDLHHIEGIDENLISQRDFSNYYTRIEIDESSSAVLDYSSNMEYCFATIGSNVFTTPPTENGLSTSQGWITAISPRSHITFSTEKPTENENKPRVGVAFYPMEGKVKACDYYLPHQVTNTKYYKNSWHSLTTLPCKSYDKGELSDLGENYTYVVTLQGPNFRLGFFDSDKGNRYGATFYNDSAPWAASSPKGYFVLKDDPDLTVSLKSSNYNYYNYNITIKNNDLFPAEYYIEDNGSLIVDCGTIAAGVSVARKISIPREQTYSSSKNDSHLILVYSREGGKEQAASKEVLVPNVPRNILRYGSFYGKGTITVTRTEHFGSATNEILSNGDYVWQGDCLSVSITGIPTGYSFYRWSTGSAATSFTYTVGTSDAIFTAWLHRSSCTFSYTLGTGRSIGYLRYRILMTDGSYGDWYDFTGSRTLSVDDQIQYSIGYLSNYASNSSGSQTAVSEVITLSSNTSRTFTAAYMYCYFGTGTGATNAIIKVDGTQVANNAWRWITNTSHSNLYYSCSFKSSNTDWSGNRAYAYNSLDMGSARSSTATGNDGWSQSTSGSCLYTSITNKGSTGKVTSIPAGSGGQTYYCTSARYYAYFRFKFTISLSLYCDWYSWGNKKALYNVYTYCQTYDWSRMASKDWYNIGYRTTMSTSSNLTLQGTNGYSLNDSSTKKWNSSLKFYYFETTGTNGGVGDLCLNGNTSLYYRNNSNLSTGVNTNVSSSGSYAGYGKCNGAATLYAYNSTYTIPDSDCYKVAKSIYDNDGPSGYGTFYICEMHPYKSNGCKTWYSESI